MKKFFANVIFFLATILAGAIIIPWNNVTQWGIPLTQMTTYELYIKGGIGALMFLFSLIYLIISIHDQNNYGEVKSSVLHAAFAPMAIVAVAALAYATALAYFIAFRMPPSANWLLLRSLTYVLLFIVLNALILFHFTGAAFRKGSPVKKIIIFLINLEFMGAALFAGYTTRNLMHSIDPAYYGSIYTYVYPAAIGVALVLYVVHLIVISAKNKKHVDENDVEEAVKEIRNDEKVQEKTEKPKKSETPVKSKKEVTSTKDSGNKTMIVSKEQTIISGEENVDPTQVLYEDVPVDSEFNKTANADKQVSSIEYYIEKPKMFKPLDPAFDQLVAYIRELPNVVTKLADERITFYVDRKPFLVLMNFGNYYRMAFRSELEKGIRLIIKFPTISKNKGTKDNLWFKANNYGDLPKDVIYDIVKTAYDNVHA